MTDVSKPRRAEPIDTRTAKNGTKTYTFQLDTGTRPDGRRIRERFTYDTKTEARKELRRISSEVEAGTYVGRTNITVEQACENWLKSRRSPRKNTVSQDRAVLKYVTKHLGGTKLQALRQEHIDDWVELLLTSGKANGEGLAVATVKRALGTLKQVTEDAARRGLVARDPAAYVEAPRQAQRKITAEDVWTREQVGVFSAKAKTQRLYAALMLSCYGLRREEVCGLRWSDVDLTTGTLSIEQAMVRTCEGEIVVDEPKAERSRRTLPIPADAVTALRELKTRQMRERLALGVSWVEASHVCSDESGEALRPEAHTDLFQIVRKAAGLPYITLRNLRHTSVSVMLHAGVPPTTVAAWHGHDVRMTTSVYNRVYDEGLTTAAAVMFGNAV
ncbi:site-specific integrase [Nocardia sp. AG03]|uniref:tyrosine-type recombinase/integrase n=1 Tax=Nocardia sp. AG03 TaxID=3025312 RepID=UPI002418A5B7|nr:site-specific integrase [Nocardia sp. AG03]